MSPHIAILRSAMAFIEKREGRYGAAMLAANVAFVVSAIVLLNLWTLLSLATVILPAAKRVVTPVGVLAVGIMLWFLLYVLARQEVAKVRAEGHPRASPGLVVVYAIASLLALFASIVLLAVT